MMTRAQGHTAAELLAVLSARQLSDGQVVFAGVGIPLLAATLAQRLRCPGLTILFEGGVIGAFIEPGKLPPSTNDQRCTKRANMVLGSAEVLLLLQRGYVDVGFMGGAQIDQYGNLIDRHNLWEMVGVRYRRSLFPGYTDTVEYNVMCPSGNPPVRTSEASADREFSVPVGGMGRAIRIEATLHYRKIDQFLLNYVLGEKAGLTAPVVDIASATATVCVERGKKATSCP